MKSEKLKNWHLRPAETKDCRLYWEWANDPQVRAMAFQPEPIPWESHLLWFENKLQSATSNLYILETDAGSPAGQIRFDLVEDGVFEVDVSISSELRGQGAGRSILSLAEHELRKTIPIARTLRARVKASNSASLALFRSAGYEEKSITTGPSGTEIALFEKKL